MNNDITKISLDSSNNISNQALNNAISSYNNAIENIDLSSSVELQEVMKSAQEAILRAQQAQADAQAAIAAANALNANSMVNSPALQTIVPDVNAMPTAAQQAAANAIQAAEMQKIQLEQQVKDAELKRLQVEQQMTQQAAAQAVAQQQAAVQAQNFSNPLDKEIDVVNLNPSTGAKSAPTASTVGNVSGSICPGTTQTTFSAKSYNLDPAAYNELLAIVYSEASERSDYITSDSMATTSAILNRLESGNYGSSIHDVISTGQFSGYHNHKFNRAINNPSVIKPEMVAAVNRVLNGERNTIARNFNGNGIRNSFR